MSHVYSCNFIAQQDISPDFKLIPSSESFVEFLSYLFDMLKDALISNLKYIYLYIYIYIYIQRERELYVVDKILFITPLRFSHFKVDNEP